MPLTPEKIVELAASGAVFTLILCLWVGAVLIWIARRRAQSRSVKSRLGLENDNPEPVRELHLWRGQQRMSTTVPESVKDDSWGRRLESMCENIGWNAGPASFLLLMVAILAATGALTGYVTGSLVMALAVAGALAIITHIYLGGRGARRRAIVERQLVDAMDLAARSLRAGHPLMGSFQLIADEMPPPVSHVFADLCQRQEMGASLEEALREAAARTRNADMKLLSTSLGIQMRSGGNLADLIGRLAGVIRERLRLNRRVKVLTAQTQMSKRVLLALPFVMFVLFNLLNPTYMAPLYDTSTGRLLIVIGVTGLAMGGWIMNRMAVLRY